VAPDFERGARDWCHSAATIYVLISEMVRMVRTQHQRNKLIFVACKPLTYSFTFVKFVIEYVTGENHITKSKFVEEYVRTIKLTKYLTIDFTPQVKCLVRICENHFCIYTFRICVSAKYSKYVITFVPLTYLSHI
jgi:hypothetical protein